MDLIDHLEMLSKNIPGQLDHIKTEEAAKTSLVLPFLNALGYNVFDPREVVPEFTADFGTKKGEKVDYAIMKEGSPAILIECKSPGGDLSTTHAAQLYRYFSVTDARVAILTNGVDYKFYSDLDASNRMDTAPFLEFNMLELREDIVQSLKSLSKSRFDVDHVVNAATELRYVKAIRKVFQQNLEQPDDDFVAFFIKAVEPERRNSSSSRDLYRPLVQKALQRHITERVKGSLSRVLKEEERDGISVPEEQSEEGQTSEPSNGIVTTEEELEGYHVVRAIMREVCVASRVVMRDVKSYCGILLDDNNRQPICRLYFNTSQKYIGLFDEEKNEDKIAIDSIDDIYEYRDRLQAVVKFYDGEDQETDA